MLTPADLVRLAATRDLRILAVTDHDSTEGIPEADGRGSGAPRFHSHPWLFQNDTDIPGDEITSWVILLDLLVPQLSTQTLARLRSARRDRGRQMLEKLRAMGIDIPGARSRAAGGGFVEAARGKDLIVNRMCCQLSGGFDPPHRLGMGRICGASQADTCRSHSVASEGRGAARTGTSGEPIEFGQAVIRTQSGRNDGNGSVLPR